MASSNPLPEKREFEYLRHGTRTLITSFCVPTGEVVWDLGLTRTSEDFGRHLGRVAVHFREFERFDWVLDNLNTHWSMEVCEYVAALSDVPFEPKQLRTGKQRRAFLTDPESQACLPFHPQAWLVAESGGVVVQRAGPAVPQAGRLRGAGGLRTTVAAVSGGLQRAPCSSLPVDVHGPTVGAWHAVQPDAAAAASRSNLGSHPAPNLGEVSLPASALQACGGSTGSELMKRSSSITPLGS